MSELSEIVGVYAQKTEISEEEFLKKQAELPKEEFSREYAVRRGEPQWDSSRQIYLQTAAHYYHIQARPKDEIQMLMLYDILQETKTVANKTSILAGIAIFGLVVGILGFIITIVSLLSH